MAIFSCGPADTIPALCRGERGLLSDWIGGTRRGSLRTCALLIVLGCGCYGFTVGLWHGWRMAGYVAVKLPAVIFLTLLLNGLLNGMLALVLGSGIGLRQSLQFLLTGFATMSIILGALSPITFFATLNTPPPSDPAAAQWHAMILLSHTAAIAFAGVVAHQRLLSYLCEFADTRRAGAHTFIAWLSGNLFVGAQISWILRPFFGTPGLAVQFLRPDPLRGNFYESVLTALRNLTPL